MDADLVVLLVAPHPLSVVQFAKRNVKMVAASGAKARPIAASIGLMFGGLWSFLGATGLPHDLQVTAEALGVAVTAALISVLWMQRGSTGPNALLFRRWGYIIAVAMEIVSIYAATILFARCGLKSYLIPAVGVIVGLHFIGLWQATRQSRFLWIAGCMCAVSALAAFLPNALNVYDPRIAAIGFGNAIVLWIGAGWSRRTN